MALKAILTEEEFGKLGDAFKGEYTKNEKTGQYALQVVAVNGWGLEDVGGLKGSLAKEREDLGKALKRAEAFGDLDPEKARVALKKLAEWGDDDPGERAKKLWGEKEKVLLDKHMAELAAREKAAADLRSQLEHHLVMSDATAAIAKHKGKVELLLPHVRSQIRIEADQAGRLVPKVIGPDGVGRVSMRTGSTDPMSIEELVEGMKVNPSYAVAFEGTGNSGSGLGGAGGGGGGAGSFRMTSAQARDPNHYARVRDQAEKAGQSVEILD